MESSVPVEDYLLERASIVDSTAPAAIGHGIGCCRALPPLPPPASMSKSTTTSGEEVEGLNVLVTWMEGKQALDAR
jgi:hypothetical protein